MCLKCLQKVYWLGMSEFLQLSSENVYWLGMSEFLQLQLDEKQGRCCSCLPVAVFPPSKGRFCSDRSWRGDHSAHIAHTLLLPIQIPWRICQVQAVLRGLGKLPQKARLCLPAECGRWSRSNLFTILPRVVLLADSVLSLAQSQTLAEADAP